MPEFVLYEASGLSQLKTLLDSAYVNRNKLLQYTQTQQATIDGLKEENQRLNSESEESIAGSSLLLARKHYAEVVKSIEETKLKITRLAQLKNSLSSTSNTHAYLLKEITKLRQRPFTSSIENYLEPALSKTKNKWADVQSQLQTTKEQIVELRYQQELQLIEIERISQNNIELRKTITNNLSTAQRIDPTTIHKRGDIEDLQQKVITLKEQLQQEMIQYSALEDEVAGLKELAKLNNRLEIQKEKLESENSFASFYNEFTALFADTNSSGIKKIMHAIQALKNTNYNDSDKFTSCAQIVQQIASKRKDRKRSKLVFFGNGRTFSTQALYDTVTDTTFAESFKDSPCDFLDKIRMDTMQHRQETGQPCPEMSFEEFSTRFITTFQHTNSSGIRVIMARMCSLNNSQNDHYNYSEICQLIHSIASKRANRFLSRSIFYSPGRSQEAQAFYTTAKNEIKSLPDYVNNLLSKFSIGMENH